jgi:hypothetical protein
MPLVVLRFFEVEFIYGLCLIQGTDDADSPMGDTESIYPDTSSMTDLAQLGRSMQGLKLRNSHSEYAVSQPTEPTDICSVNSLSEGVTLVKSQSDRLVLAP